MANYHRNKDIILCLIGMASLWLCSYAVFTCAECGFMLSCWNKHGYRWKGWCLKGSKRCSKICSALIILNCIKLVTIWIVLFFCSTENTTSNISINREVDSLTTIHDSTVHQLISDELEPREVSSVSGRCWYMTSAMHSTVFTCICGCIEKQCFSMILEIFLMLWFPSQKHAGF